MEVDALSASVLLSAAGVAFLHTAAGPDHYLPFIMLARSNGWSAGRTLLVTFVCGLGHVLSSILLGGLGVLAGVAVSRLELVDGLLGNLAAWSLVAFGVAYGLWGVRRGLREKRGIAVHAHRGHAHVHVGGDQPHGHDERLRKKPSFWFLFVIFVLGPCEPLIPLFILPASDGRWGLALLLAAVFGAVTIVTMLALTLAAHRGLRTLGLGLLERWMHALSGAVIAASGTVILTLGW